jgi:hypothetical protein
MSVSVLKDTCQYPQKCTRRPSNTLHEEDVQIKGTMEDAGVKIICDMAIQHTSDCRHAQTICLKIPKTSKP